MGYDFDWASLQRAWPYLLQGLQMTAFLVVVAMAAGIGLGTLLAITESSRHGRWRPSWRGM